MHDVVRTVAQKIFGSETCPYNSITLTDGLKSPYTVIFGPFAVQGVHRRFLARSFRIHDPSKLDTSYHHDASYMVHPYEVASSAEVIQGRTARSRPSATRVHSPAEKGKGLQSRTAATNRLPARSRPSATRPARAPGSGPTSIPRRGKRVKLKFDEHSNISS